MNRRKFVVTSSLVMVLIAGTVTGLALYSNYVVRASIPGVPQAVAYLPVESQGVFGMNVEKFVASPVFARLEQKHGDIGKDLQEFIASTGVDPRRDLYYLIGGGRAIEDRKGEGVVIAVGRFNSAAITSFLQTKGQPIQIDYKGARVLMMPERNDNDIDKGLAFLSESEIAVGDLESLKKVLDVREGSHPGILTNTTLAPLIQGLNPEEMFWFAGDARSVLARAPANTPFLGSISAVQNVVGTLSLTDAVNGRITATARDVDSATKLADVARGFLALGQLAGEYHGGEISELLKGVNISQDKTQVRLTINFPFELLEKLEEGKFNPKKVL